METIKRCIIIKIGNLRISHPNGILNIDFDTSNAIQGLRITISQILPQYSNPQSIILTAKGQILNDLNENNMLNTLDTYEIKLKDDIIYLSYDDSKPKETLLILVVFIQVLTFFVVVCNTRR